MKRLLLEIFVFGIILTTTAGAVLFVISQLINNGDYYSLDTDSKYLFLGHSHAECAFNDKYINKSINLAKSGESYFYTYAKLKAILKHNDHFEAVFIEFTNNYMSKELDGWIWKDNFLLNNYPKYSTHIGFSEHKILFRKNLSSLISAQSIALRNNLSFLIKYNDNIITQRKWGGYLLLDESLDEEQLDSMKLAIVPEDSNQISELNLIYLHKIIALCRENKIAAFLIRSPLHPSYPGIANEDTFRTYINEFFMETPFLDFKDYVLSDKYYADLEHLNFDGAKEFSIHLNDLIESGLLHMPNNQEVIDRKSQEINIHKRQ